MKLQFSLASQQLLMTCVAIACAGVLAAAKIASPTSGISFGHLRLLLLEFICTSPVWIPFVFAGVAIALKKLSAKMVLAFGIAEAVSIGIVFGLTLWLRGY